MRLSRSDLVAPVLAIVVGGVIGVSLSDSFLHLSRSDDVPAPDPAVVLSATQEAVRLEEQRAMARNAYLAERRGGTVRGQITDAQSGQPIAAVQVFIRSLDLGGLSQQNGSYLLQNVPSGTYTLTVARIGYRTREAQITVRNFQPVDRNFSIAEEALQLDAIVVGRTPVIATAEIDQDVTIAPTTFATKESPDVSVAPVFTPMTVRPEIRNLAEVQQALMREYPSILRDAGIGGQVMIWFFISETGEVLASRIDQSSGHAQLDEAALKVADVFRFTPARNRDERVQVWVQLPIVFEAQN